MENGLLQGIGKVASVSDTVPHVQLITLPPEGGAVAIFNFSVFFTALALMGVLFTISDVRFKFRIAVAPLPLILISYILITLIGLAVLLLDVASAQRWPVPGGLGGFAYWQAACGAAFYVLVLTWVYYGFIRPPRFGRSNALKYARELYRHILRGDEVEMTSLAHELQRSVISILRISNAPERRERRPPFNSRRRPTAPKQSAADHANTLLALIGTRRFCRTVATNAPGTAIEFFKGVTEHERYNAPLQQFALNVSVEAIENPHSLLHHEDSGYSSGALGHWKPFSQALYGDYRLVDALRPLNIPYELWWTWKAEQWKIYARASAITIADYVRRARWGQRSQALADIFEAFEHSVMDVRKLNGATNELGLSSDAYERLDVAVGFLKAAMDEVAKLDPPPKPVNRGMPKDFHSEDLYDWLAKLGYQLILAASNVRQGDMVWTVQYNAVWSPIFDREDQPARAIISRKIIRHLIKEITRWDDPNYLSARLVGMTLNCVGIKPGTRENSWGGDYALRKFMLHWSRRNLMKLWEKNPEVVEWGLPDNLRIDAGTRRLVRTFPKHLERKPKLVYWQLD